MFTTPKSARLGRSIVGEWAVGRSVVGWSVGAERVLSGAGTLDVCPLAALLRMCVSDPRLALEVSGGHQPAMIP